MDVVRELPIIFGPVQKVNDEIYLWVIFQEKTSTGAKLFIVNQVKMFHLVFL